MEVLTRNTILALSIVLEAALLLVAAVWMHFGHIQLLPQFTFQTEAFIWGAGLAVVTSTISVVLILLGKRVPFLSELKKMTEDFLQPLVGLLNFTDIAFLSLLSGFAEEVLFRGIVQAQIGLVPASIVFGFFHDPTLKQRAYVILATLAGLALGYMYQQNNNIWSCIVAHALHNLIAMTALRYFVKIDKSKNDPPD